MPRELQSYAIEAHILCHRFSQLIGYENARHKYMKNNPFNPWLKI